MISVYYDARCPFCQACAAWLKRRASHSPLRLVPADSAEAKQRVGIPWLGIELVVVHDDGRFWVGPAAFLVCLWALRGGRALANFLSCEPLALLSRYFFESLSAGRGHLSVLMGRSCEGMCRSSGAYR